MEDALKDRELNLEKSRKKSKKVSRKKLKDEVEDRADRFIYGDIDDIVIEKRPTRSKNTK